MNEVNTPGKHRSSTRVLTGFLALLFLAAGAAKVAHLSMMVENYARWGYPDVMLYIVGGAELLGALMLLLPRAASYGSGLLGLVMVGAVATHLMANELPMVVVPAVLFLALTLTGWVWRCEAFDTMWKVVPWMQPPTCEEGV